MIEKLDGILKNFGALLSQAEDLGHGVEALAVPKKKLENYWVQVKAMEKEQLLLKELRRQLPLHGMTEPELQAKLGKAAQVFLKTVKGVVENMIHGGGNKGDDGVSFHKGQSMETHLHMGQGKKASLS